MKELASTMNYNLAYFTAIMIATSSLMKAVHGEDETFPEGQRDSLIAQHPFPDNFLINFSGNHSLSRYI